MALPGMVTEENCQRRENDAECSQREAINANAINVAVDLAAGFAWRRLVASVGLMNRIHMRERVRRLEHRDE